MILLAAIACGGPPVPADPPCAGWGEPQKLDDVQSGMLSELSGLAPASADGVYWTMNDSGDRSRVFAIDVHGKLRATVLLGGDAVDFEDVAVGGGKLIVADTGDNEEKRRDAQLLIVDEPKIDTGEVLAERLLLRFPDKVEDVEALVVDPRDGSRWLIGKGRVGGLGGIYRVKDSGELVREGQVEVIGPSSSYTLITAATISPDGQWAAIRTYATAYLWPMAADQTLAEALAGPRCRLPLPDQPQGESLTFAPDGKALLTVSEGVHPPIWRIPRE